MEVNEHGSIHGMELHLLALFRSQRTTLIEDALGSQQFSHVMQVRCIGDHPRLAGIENKVRDMTHGGRFQHTERVSPNAVWMLA